MIIKILPRKRPSFKALINYILKEEKNSTPTIFTHNLRSILPSQVVKEFLINESYRTDQRSNRNYLYHECISMGRGDRDKITNEMLESIFYEYVSHRGENGLYYAGVHNDRKHTHIHVIASGSELYTGKANRISKPDLESLKLNLEAYALNNFPELTHSFCEHGSHTSYDQTPIYILKRNTMKNEVTQKIQTLLDQASSKTEFNELLLANNLYSYERNGVVKGIIYDNVKFRFSSIDIDHSKVEALPDTLSEEEKTLKELSDLRERHGPTRYIVTEKDGLLSTIFFNSDQKEVVTDLPSGEVETLTTDLTPDEYNDLERMEYYINLAEQEPNETRESGVQEADHDLEI